MAMTSRERVLTAIDHHEPDRVPFFFGVDNTVSIQMPAYRELLALLGVRAEDTYLYDWAELGTAAVDEVVLRMLGSDVRGVWDRKPSAVVARNAGREPGTPYFDDFGVGQIQLGPDEWMPHIHPIKEPDIDALEDFDWPDMDDMTRYDGIRERSEHLGKAGQYAVVGAPWLLFPFERACQMLGMDVLMMAMVTEPDYVRALFGRLVGLYKKHLQHFMTAGGGYIDILVLGDDLGMETNMLISPRMYRELLKSFHAELIAHVKRLDPAVKVFFHTDGDVFDVLDDLAEIGVDILNPVQTSAGRMSDLAELKTRFGKRLCFCGGIDTKRILPFGSPGDVRAEVKRVIDQLGPGGGYMAASVHTIMRDVPAQNVVAMAEAIHEFGNYPLIDRKA